MTQKLPLVLPSTLRANENEAKPRYDTPAHWSMGATGNEADIATISTPVVTSATNDSVTPYSIRTQVAKGAAMVPPFVPLSDLGKDYGTYSGAAGRAGTIQPRQPYPTTP